MQGMSWQERAAAKRDQQLEAVPREWVLKNLPETTQLDVSEFPKACQFLSGSEMKITESPVDVLLMNLTKGTWTAVEVTIAFSKRAIIAHQLVNCLTEIFINSALTRAAGLDDHLRRTGSVVGPLHGLPISLKDQVGIKGLDATMGFVSNIGSPSTKNSVLADILENLGAVLYVKTNVPQGCMWGETYNYIFGRTLNPFNRSLTAGGSSGGEGALIALIGSPLGVGSDLGGSIRIPAAFNGVYGLRPSFNRIPYAGCVNTYEGQNSVLSVMGPMSMSMEGIRLFMKSVLMMKPWQYDPLVIRKQWNEDEYHLVDYNLGKELCFAVLWDDGETVPHPPVMRGLEVTKQALVQAGHKVIDWKPIRHSEINQVAGKIWSAVGDAELEAITANSGEPIIGTMETSIEDLSTISEPMHRWPPVSLTAFEYWQVNAKQRELRQLYLDHWRETVSVTGTGRPIDAIIAPVAPYVAPPHGGHIYPGYTCVWNFLDYPACVVPLGLKVDPLLDVKTPRDSFHNDADQKNWESYDPDVYKNAPIAIQVVGRTLEDEAVVGISEIVDRALKTYQSATKA
ncbi:hypothetical protein D9756_002880 [Leucocoprinus leucothites]|uniref:amidase n=1 Tax=Leucocoprinus leucothites TaxID=201217 RepID=A0A8H5G692_9AGAR|nr:hypothetical protein D9756_002880 [Leucoagaricus leucothites]